MASLVKTEHAEDEDGGRAEEEVVVSQDENDEEINRLKRQSPNGSNSETEVETIVKIKPTSINVNKTTIIGHHQQQQQTTRVPIVKQMEQMMSRNYSDFMRSLAAKYNNRNPAEEEQEESLNHVNGFMHKLDSVGRIGDVILKSSTPPLLNSMDSHGLDDVIRKSDSHSAPPILLDHQRSPGQLLRPMVDLSSTQMLLHMMRSASSAIAASESSGAVGFGSGGHKRNSVEVEDVLDLSVKASNSNKRWRGGHSVVEGCGGLTMAADPIGLLSRATGQRGRLNINNNNRASSESYTDLSRSSMDASDVIKKTNPRATFNQRKQHACVVNCPCRDKDRKSPSVIHWNVDDVCAFVSGVDACADYVQAFRDQSIDGGALYMLTEDHLTNRMKMKLGHALRFKAALAKLIGACAVCLHCVHCHQQQPQQQSNGGGALQR